MEDSPSAPSKKIWKYCFVPRCENTEFKNRDMLFICVPVEEKKRMKWFKAVRRIESGKGNKTRFHCCEEHFELASDIENYMQLKLQPGKWNVRLKKDAVPSRFACQASSRTPDRLSTSIGTGRQSSVNRAERNFRREVVELVTNAVETVEEEQTDPVVESCADDCTDIEMAEESLPKFKDTGTQVRASFRTKCIQTEAILPMKVTVGTSTEDVAVPRKRPCPRHEEDEEIEVDDEDDMSDGDADWTLEGSSCSSEDEQCATTTEEQQMQCLPNTRLLNRTHSRTYLGILDGCYYIVEELANLLIYGGRQLNAEDVVCLILRKIRLDSSFTVLAHQFDISKSTAAAIFRQYLPLLRSLLNDAIIWPSAATIREHIPLSFRARYSAVTSIIDCLEIHIQKPSKALHQSLTWSDYKHANTAKYLVSITPSGLVNFVSSGYGGRASDIVIVKESGYLTSIPYSTVVMADRGFKQIETVLKNHDCKLIRPESVKQDEPLSTAQVVNSKKIASLRIHVERAIRRIREFQMLTPCSCVPKDLLDLLDDAMVVACGLTNLQGPLVKN